LFEIDLTEIGGPVDYFHGHRQAGDIVWQGKRYAPWAITAEGFAYSGQGPSPMPTLSVGNVNGLISALCLALDDLVGGRLVRRRTLGQYLDAESFPDGSNPAADPTQELPPETWFIERKAHEDNESVAFELSSPLDFGDERLPRRQIISNRCTWKYRSAECGYTGGPRADENDVPTDDPAKDKCSGCLRGCKLRFGENNPLPFGGFPAAGLIRT
jgi:lambda family phage minor tail protein L